MSELTVNDSFEKYPYFKKMAEYTLFLPKEEVDKLKNSETIIIDKENVSIEFLKCILDEDIYFDYVSKYFNNTINRFVVAYILLGDLGGNISYKKRIIVNGIEKLVSTGKISLNKKQLQRFEYLKKAISFEKFLDKYKDTNFSIKIDDSIYSFSIKELISIMQLSEEKFDNLCFNNEIKEINGIRKEYYIYGLFKFFKESNLMEEYLLPDSFIKRYMDIASLQKIDLQAINKFLTTADTKYQNVKIDKNLESSIISMMPLNVSDLEKAIYIYIKMCKLLTYDEEYYAVNQKGVATKKHKNIDFVSLINLNNNKVVCFEFNLIYSKLLSKLDIHFASDYKGMVGEAYGESHANLIFRYDKFLVMADSVTSILQGDMTKAKLNQPLIGLKCVNKNHQTKKEFKELLTKMYKLVAEQDRSIETYKVEHIQTMEELLNDYSHITQNIKDVGLEERLLLLIDKVNATGMVGIDSLSYILQLRKTLFTEEQRANNIGIFIVRNNEPYEEGKIAMASAIFIVNYNGFEEKPEHNNYYYFKPNHKLIPITKKELQERFNEGLLSYIREDDPKILGIIENGGIKKC